MRLVSVLLVLPLAVGASVENVVHVTSGTLAGKLQGNTIVFEGIPFAAPPIGDLRWREPQPVASWSGIRDATTPGSPCVQSVHGVDSFLAPLAEEYGVHFAIETLKPSEDCLYLNVFSPSSGSKRLPVMVWLHGGSNRAGSGSGDGYDGSSLASHGVVVVTMNYRLGVMGFFAHPDLTAESPHHSSGNYGLLDQIAGLRWVQQNIEQFGGDPRNVTLFGESAGSVDATMLIASPLVKGLFRRVIAESGPAFGLAPAVKLSDAEAVGKAVGTAKGNALAALRQMGAQEVADLDARVVASRFKSFDPNSAVVDGWLLPRPAAAAYGSGSIQKVDLLAGFNGRELSAFRVVAAAAAKQSPTPPAKEPATAAVKKLADAAYPLYGGWTDMAVGMYLAQILVHGDIAVDRASNDMLVACPVGAEVALVTRLGARGFIYRFDRSIPGKGEQKLGAFHAEELPFVFNTFTSRSWRWLPFTEADRNLSAVIETYWTNFARSGDPNGAGLPAWKAWSSDDEPYMQFSQSAAAVPQKSFSPPFCHLAPDRLQERLAEVR
jgi:para-nitrobenzyl esterase